MNNVSQNNSAMQYKMHQFEINFAFPKVHKIETNKIFYLFR